MTDLIKDWRELHAKTTQGKRYITGICAGSTAIGIEGNEKASMFLENNADAEFIVKAHNDLPKLLDELEFMTACKDRVIKQNRRLLDEKMKYKKALELCKEQRNSQLIMDSEDLELIQEYDEELDQILEGEVAG